MSQDTPLVSNVLAVYRMANAEQLRNGLSWYLDAHNTARVLDPNRVHRAAGVIAALSPMMGWEANKRAAMLAYKREFADGLGLSRNCQKANRILYGEHPLDVLGGNKVRAFYATIENPTGDIDPVIDRHAFDIAVGEVTDDKRRSALSRKGVYAEFAHVYREAAILVGIGSAQMQAVTWVTWRDLKKAGELNSTD